jgi:hypothetical protein
MVAREDTCEVCDDTGKVTDPDGNSYDCPRCSCSTSAQNYARA